MSHVIYVDHVGQCYECANNRFNFPGAVDTPFSRLVPLGRNTGIHGYHVVALRYTGHAKASQGILSFRSPRGAEDDDPPCYLRIVVSEIPRHRETVPVLIA